MRSCWSITSVSLDLQDIVDYHREEPFEFFPDEQWTFKSGASRIEGRLWRTDKSIIPDSLMTLLCSTGLEGKFWATDTYHVTRMEMIPVRPPTAWEIEQAVSGFKAIDIELDAV